MRADRNAGDLHLDGTRTETSRLSRSLRLRFPSGLSPSPSDPILLSVMKKPAIIPNSIMAVQRRKGRSEQVNIHTMTFI